jgi:hypothetical protein
MTRLQELGFTDFTGGLNVRDSRSFQIADNESPQMLNMRADERLGVYTRKGMARWNATPVVASGVWNPRSAHDHLFADGTMVVFVTNEQRIHAANASTTFAPIAYPSTAQVRCNASPHLASFASWGDSVYIATGRKVDVLGAGERPVRYNKAGTTTVLQPTGLSTYNDNYAIPVRGVMPQCDFLQPHAGYLFAASMQENFDGTTEDYPSRLRWSHPNSAEDWARQDFLDIEIGGGRITGLSVFQDHLLIFKTNSIWALYGYDSESWQLVQVSETIGTTATTAITATPGGVFFYCTCGRGSIHVYRGEKPERISDNIEEVVQNLPADRVNDVWMNWATDRLLVSLPWISDWDPMGGSSATSSSLFTWDPFVNERGAWEMHRPAKGSIGPIMGRFDSTADRSLVVLYGATVQSCLLQLDGVDGASDIVDDMETQTPFLTRYATNWKFGETPELRKHWMRPRFILRVPRADFTMLVEVFRDYDEVEPKRTFQLQVTAEGRYFWRDLGFDDPAGDGFDWSPTDPAGRGGIWSGDNRGGFILRGKSFGISRSVQVVFGTSPASVGQEWGLDAVILKYIDRRFTT